jgi:hypothetical protein
MVKVLNITNLESIEIPYKSEYGVLNTGILQHITREYSVLGGYENSSVRMTTYVFFSCLS